jgi:uncharacterized protein (TIGR00730 family)
MGGMGPHGFSGGSASYKKHEVKTVTLVAGGSKASARLWKDRASEVAQIFLKKKWAMVYCGMGGGLGGRIAKQILDGGGEVHAVVIKGREPEDLPDKAQVVTVSSYFERQQKLYDLGDGALVLAGGSGVLAEFAELIVLREAGMYRKALVLYDPDKWFKSALEFYQSAWQRRVLRTNPKWLFADASTVPSPRSIPPG